MLLEIFFFFFFSPMPPHVVCGLRGPPSWAWQECNLLLSLGRQWGAVTLSRWSVSGDRWGCIARRALKPKVYKSTQTMDTVGIFPFRENSHGRAWNRTRDLMVSSQRLWPLDHEAGLLLELSRNILFKSPTRTRSATVSELWLRSLVSLELTRIRGKVKLC